MENEKGMIVKNLDEILGDAIALHRQAKEGDNLECLDQFSIEEVINATAPSSWRLRIKNSDIDPDLKLSDTPFSSREEAERVLIHQLLNTALKRCVAAMNTPPDEQQWMHEALPFWHALYEDIKTELAHFIAVPLEKRYDS